MANGWLGALGILSWWNNQFTDDQRKRISSKFRPFSGELADGDIKPNTTKYMFISDMQDSFKAKADKEIFDILERKLKDLIPKNIPYDKDRFSSDSRYKAWFYIRESNFLKLNDMEKKDSSFMPFVLWSAITDQSSPSECLKLNGMCYERSNSDFKNLVESHWREVNSGCRCSLVFMRNPR